MERLNVKYQEQEFEEVPGTLKLDITMAKDNMTKKKIR